MALLSGWNNYQPHFIDYTNKIGGSVTGRRVIIFLNADNEDTTKVFDEIGANWKKQAFTMGDGETQLYAEIEFWDAENKIGIIHVSKSDWTIDEDTYVYHYYDNTHADNDDYIGVSPDDVASNNVWKSDLKMVLHMNDSDIGSIFPIKDSTSNINNGEKRPFGSISYTASYSETTAYLQGVATDGTYIYVSARGAAYPGILLKYEIVEGSLSLVTSNDSLTNCTQIADLYYKDGYLYVVDATLVNDPDSTGGRLVRFNASDLSYVDIPLSEGIEGYFTEGVTFYNNYWWLTFGSYAGGGKVRKYNSSFVFVKEYTLPNVPTNQGFQGLDFYEQDGEAYLLTTIHDGEDVDEKYLYIYYYDSSMDEFYYVTKKAPTSTHTHDQGLFCETREDGAVVWFADRTKQLISNEDLSGIIDDAALTTETTGQINKCQQFNGSTNYIITIPVSQLQDLGSVTLGGWIYESSGGTAQTSAFSCHESNGFVLGYSSDSSDKKLFFACHIGGSYRVAKTDLAISANTWYYVVGVYDGSYVKIYLNGVLQSSPVEISGNITNPTYPLCIGVNIGVTPNGYWNGRIDDCFVAPNAILSAAEVKMEYNTGNDSLLTYGSEVIVEGTLSINVYDSLSLAESETAKSNPLKLSVYDSPSLTDSISSFLNPLKLTLYDSVSLAEDLTSYLSFLKVNVYNEISLTDALAVKLAQLKASAYDSISLEDYLDVAVLITLYIDVSDNVSLTDYNEQFLTLLKASIYDSVSVSESIDQFLSLLKISIDESISLSESSLCHITPLLIALYDSLSVSEDSVCYVNPLLIALYDSVSLSDVVSLLKSALVVSVYDSILAADALATGITPIFVLVYDGLSLSDSITAEKPFYGLLIYVYDSLTVGDIRRTRADSASWQKPEDEDESTAIWSRVSGDYSTTWSKVIS